MVSFIISLIFIFSWGIVALRCCVDFEMVPFTHYDIKF